MDSRSKIIIFFLFLAGLTINALSVYTWDVSHIANDGIQYLSTAKNWLAGNGFSTDTLMYTPHFQGTFPAAQTVWPPGYPLAVAFFMKLGFDPATASLALNLTTHALASLLMWLLLRKMGIDRIFATACTFAFYFMSMPWAYVSAGMTEPLFTSMLLSALLLLPNPKSRGVLWWILCGLIIALCVYVRYSSVFFAAGTGAGIGLYLLLYERTTTTALFKPVCKLALLLALPVLAFLHLMHRTHSLIGTLDRYSGSKEAVTLLSTIKRWLVEASELTGFSSGEVISSTLSTALFIITMLLIAVILTWFTAGSMASDPDRDTTGNIGGSVDFLSEKSIRNFRLISLVAMFHALALIIYLSIASMGTSPLEIISRYIYQFYPGIYATFCFMLYALFKRHPVGNKSKWVRGLTITLTTIYLVVQINATLVSRPHYFGLTKSAGVMMNLPVSNGVRLVEHIKDCFTSKTTKKSIWSTHGQPIHIHTGLPTLTHADIYTKQPFDADHLAARVSEYNVGMFVFVSSERISNPQYDSYMNAIKSWIIDQGFVEVTLLADKFGTDLSAELYVTPECSI